MIYKRSGLALMAALFFAVLAGVAILTGRSDYHGAGAMLLASALVVLGCVVLTITARRWAGYFTAACALGLAKAILELVTGYHSLPNAPLMTLTAVLSLALLTALSYRFADRLPRSRFEAIALTGSVLALAVEMVHDDYRWPIPCAMLLLGTSWVADWLTRRGSHRHRRAIRQGAKQ
jgi:hypothetical protein